MSVNPPNRRLPKSADYDTLRLQHMLEAARHAIQFLEQRIPEDLDTDLQLRLSIERLLEIIGEAAAHVTETTQANLAQVAWADMIGMRNFLTHGYFITDASILWNTVQSDLPGLVKALEEYGITLDAE